MYEANFNTTWVPVAVRSYNNTFIASIAVSAARAAVTNRTSFSSRLAVQAGAGNYFRLHLDFTAQTATAYVTEVLVGSVPFPSALHDIGFVDIGAFQRRHGRSEYRLSRRRGGPKRSERLLFPRNRFGRWLAKHAHLRQCQLPNRDVHDELSHPHRVAALCPV